MTSHGYDLTDYSWYFGCITRSDTEKLFHQQTNNGLFLVRESSRSKHDFVLCVRDYGGVKQYLISEKTVDGEKRFIVGSEIFPDLISVLRFYQTHYIEGNLHLTRPVPPLHRVITTHNLGETNEHLGFKSGEVFDVLSRGDGDHCWTARSQKGRIGMIPSSYVSIYHEGDTLPKRGSVLRKSEPVDPDAVPSIGTRSSLTVQEAPQHISIKLPTKARVIRDRVKTYDKAELNLHVDDIVTVLEVRRDGQWYGRIGAEEGLFPFRHVKLLDPE